MKISLTNISFLMLMIMIMIKKLIIQTAVSSKIKLNRFNKLK